MHVQSDQFCTQLMTTMQMAAQTVAKDVLVSETHLMYQSLVFWLDLVPF